MQQKNYIINKCIYCNGVGQTDEHIIPLALGGRRVLLKASCNSCRDITSRCESNLLQKNWVEARASLGYPSSHRNFEDEKFSLNVIYKDGSEGVLELPKSEILGFAGFLEYPLPAFFKLDNYKRGININAQTTIAFGDNKAEDLFRKYGLKSIKYVNKDKGTNFGKMIAKIGYCETVALLGFNSLDKCFLLPVLLDKKDDIGFWVGCDHEESIVPLIGKQRVDNKIVLHILAKVGNDTRYVIARLKFFAFSCYTPEYIVVVGTLKPDFIIPDYDLSSGGASEGFMISKEGESEETSASEVP